MPLTKKMHFQNCHFLSILRWKIMRELNFQHRILLVLVIFVCNIQFLNAQFKVAYQIGSIGSMGLKQRVFSGPVSISDSSCFAISNGVNTLKHHTNLSAFRINCELLYVETPVIDLTPYPNPSSSYVIVKSAVSVPFQKTNPKVQMDLFDLSGRLIHEYSTGLYDLNNGYQINISNLTKGPYFIRVSIVSVGFVHTVKIIKES